MMIEKEKKANQDSKFTFIALDVTSWDGMWMNRQQIMSRIGKDSHVVYSTGPQYSWDLRSDIKSINLLSRLEKKDNIQLYTPSSTMARIPSCPFIDTKNISRFVHSLNKKWGEGTRVLYVFHPSFVDYIKDIEYDILVYHCYDNYSKMHGSDPWLNKQEKEMCVLADLVFASSENNAERLSLLSNNPKAVHFIPNGVDLSLFSDYAIKSKEEHHLKRKVKAGYVGSMNDKFDFGLMLNIAKSLPEVDFLLVGRANNLNERDAVLFDEIKKLSNVEVRGLCKREEVPALLASVDLNLFLYKSGSFADECYPLKLHEAFAIGNPIISTPIKSVSKFHDVVSLPKTESEWLSMIKNELKIDSDERRQQRLHISSMNTWEIRVESILNKIKQIR